MSHKTSFLLNAKLQVPSPIPSSLEPMRLVTELNQTPHHAVILVTAPAAYGKTTTINTWLASRQSFPFAWLNLDQADNDIAHFLACLSAAVQGVIKRSSNETSKQAQPQLTLLLNEITAYDSPFTLVLDNYQVITNEAVHAALQHLLDYKPSYLQIVFISRCLPPLNLAQLRLRHRLHHIQADDLRFTPELIEIYLAETVKISLPASTIAALDEKMQGWIGGWQLLTAVFGSDVFRYEQGFTDLYHPIFEYFASEVWSGVSAQTREILLTTAVPEKLSPALCATLLPHHNDPQLLDNLANNGYFLTSANKQQYQYHPLFRSFLHEQLNQCLSCPQVRALHQRTCCWYQSQSEHLLAIPHAFATKDYQLIVALLEETAWRTWQAGQSSQLLEWFDQLPEPIITAQPRLCLYHAWELSSAGYYQRASQRLAQAAALIDESNNEDIAYMYTAFAIMLQFRLNPHAMPTIAESQHALQQLPPKSHHWQTLAYLSLGVSAQIAGQPTTAQDALYEALNSSRQSQSPYLMTLAYYNLITAHLNHGRLRQAKRVCQQLHIFATQTPAPNLCQTLSEQFLGKLNLYQNKQTAAAHHLQTALALCQELHIRGLQSGILQHISWLKVIAGDLDAAFLITEQLMTLVRLDEAEIWGAHEALIALKLEHWERVEYWLRQVRPQLYPQTTTYHQKQYGCYFNLLLIYLAKGHKSDLGQLRNLLIFLRHQPVIQSNLRHTIHLHIIEASLHYLQNNMVMAVAALQRALSFARKEGYLLPFLLIGPPVPALLAASDHHSLYRPFIQSLLAAMSQSTLTSAPNSLSSREREILKLVAAGLSNQQISQALIITPNTVKTHLKRINVKLQTSNRAAAVATAQTLNFL